jgi:hypothetical protein
MEICSKTNAILWGVRLLYSRFAQPLCLLRKDDDPPILTMVNALTHEDVVLERTGMEIRYRRLSMVWSMDDLPKNRQFSIDLSVLGN